MDSNTDFKKLWHQQVPVTSNIGSFLDYARAYRRKQTIGKWKSNAMLLATVVFVGYIVSQIRPLEWMTLCGGLLVMISVLLYLALYNRMFASLGNADIVSDNRVYLKQLLNYQGRQQFLFRQGLAVYYLLLSLGFGLYMWPFLRRMSLLYAIAAVALTGGWILLGWFYFKPRRQRREAAALQAVIDQYKELSLQLEKPEATV